MVMSIATEPLVSSNRSPKGMLPTDRCSAERKEALTRALTGIVNPSIVDFEGAQSSHESERKPGVYERCWLYAQPEELI